MRYVAVSDLAPERLEQFITLMQAQQEHPSD
jgi:hypothetical protein